MKKIPAQLPIILHYLNWKSGNERVKERLENTYEWLQYKLSRIAGHEQVNELQNNPFDPKVQQQWKAILEEAIDEDDLSYEELYVRLQEALAQIQAYDPDAYQTLLAKQKGVPTAGN